MKIECLESNFDGLKLEIAITEPKENKKIKGIVQISHGMSENKERYYDFMNFLSENGYVCVIHDHRGHGNSVKDANELGYFYTEDYNAIISDLYQITQYIKQKYEDKKIYLFSHSMGTLVARNYMKKHDSEIEKIILCGPPTKNSMVSLGLNIAKVLKIFEGDISRSKLLNKLVFGSYNKGYKKENEWICSNPEIVDNYNLGEKTGFIFTINGFINLFKLMEQAFNSKDWTPTNIELPILIIAGAEDPVIQNEKKFNQLVNFLSEVGYKNISNKLYSNKRHELLNEIGKGEIYQSILEYFDN